MTRTLTLSLISALLLSAGAPAAARGDRNRDQDNLREAAAQGQVVPLGRLIADIRSRPQYNDMTYLVGPQFDAGRRDRKDVRPGKRAPAPVDPGVPPHIH